MQSMFSLMALMYTEAYIFCVHMCEQKWVKRVGFCSRNYEAGMRLEFKMPFSEKNDWLKSIYGVKFSAKVLGVIFSSFLKCM